MKMSVSNHRVNVTLENDSHTTSATDRIPDEPQEQRDLEEPPGVTSNPGLCGCLKPADKGDLLPPVKNNFISAGEGN